MGDQHGFFFDQSRCYGCHACALACKSWHALGPGPTKYLRIYEYEKGAFPNVRIHYQWVPCYHCEEPACVRDCPDEAIYKEPKYGAVLIDEDKCSGCRLCYDSCPYGALVFESHETVVKAKKCDMCFDRLKKGETPVCVLACPTRALDFGRFPAIVGKYGDNRDLEDLPSSRATRPAVIFKPHTEKRLLVPYSVPRALELLAKREPLPPVFSSETDVTELPQGMIGRDRLVLKHESTDDLMQRTKNDEG